ncbi:MAG: 30S ribosomal protein S17e [Nitrososphaeria archaeon]|jgi:small subunit ribosomal protein S17e
MNRIRRIANELLQKFPDKFTDNFEANKKALNELVVMNSKYVRNKVAGYITRMVKRSRVKSSVEQ